MKTPATAAAPLSVPVRPRTPRRLDERERTTLARIADSLVPETGSSPAPSSEADFGAEVDVALDARADAFDIIVSVLAALADVPAAAVLDRLEALHADDPAAFQAVSTVVVGAWLLTAGTRARIGYDGPRSTKAGLEEAADEISSGILDPVLERHDNDSPRWIR